MAPIRRSMFPVLLLLILFALLALGARELSFTSDEPAHIATGYALIARGKMLSGCSLSTAIPLS